MATAVSVFDLIRNRIQNQAHATAVSVRGESLTYAELDVASRKIADLLRKRGVNAGDIVPILTTRCREMVPCVLAVIRVGACWVPMEAVTWSKGRIDTVLKTVDHKIVLTTGDESNGIQNAISLNEIREAMVGGFKDNDVELESQEGPRCSQDAAYIIFTSGTTGRPKGVTIAHQSLLHYVQQGDRDAPFNLGVNSADTVLLLFSVAFDGELGPHTLKWYPKTNLLSPSVLRCAVQYTLQRRTCDIVRAINSH